MTLPERIQLILKENALKQNEFASILGVSPSYISSLISGRNKTVSPALAEVIEHRLGYATNWVLNGVEPKMKTRAKNPGLSIAHQRAIAQVEQMSEAQARAVLAFIRSLEEVESILKG
ncbi:hypothetical protein CE91St41_26840 [Oscillospiraceae bacterium]|nr:hypothetical protein CE91St40_10700 [Oscillospiraceae bacterium]BDF75795.1 hypothetical protein CE91St41_26840 [Oscillospiraceae bacterium]